MSVSQEGVPQITVNFTGGFKFHSSSTVAFQLARFLYYRKSYTSGSSTYLLGDGPVTISDGQTYTVTNSSAVKIPSGSIFMGFKFQFSSYSGTFPSKISLAETNITVYSSTVRASAINNRTLNNGDEVFTYCSNLTLSSDCEIDTTNLVYQLQ